MSSGHIFHVSSETPSLQPQLDQKSPKERGTTPDAVSSFQSILEGCPNESLMASSASPSAMGATPDFQNLQANAVSTSMHSHSLQKPTFKTETSHAPSNPIATPELDVKTQGVIGQKAHTQKNSNFAESKPSLEPKDLHPKQAEEQPEASQKAHTQKNSNFAESKPPLEPKDLHPKQAADQPEIPSRLHQGSHQPTHAFDHLKSQVASTKTKAKTEASETEKAQQIAASIHTASTQHTFAHPTTLAPTADSKPVSTENRVSEALKGIQNMLVSTVRDKPMVSLKLQDDLLPATTINISPKGDKLEIEFVIDKKEASKAEASIQLLSTDNIKNLHDTLQKNLPSFKDIEIMGPKLMNTGAQHQPQPSMLNTPSSPSFSGSYQHRNGQHQSKMREDLEEYYQKEYN